MKGIGMLNWHLDVTIACPKTKVLNALAEDSYHFISSVYVYMKFR